ncbi:MAG: hypothetical protein LKF51_17120, partial [Serratia liquefaciens]|nr:hypothetical protein [Serratia liquefaciens]
MSSDLPQTAENHVFRLFVIRLSPARCRAWGNATRDALFQQCLRLGHHVIHGEAELFEQLLC